MPPIFNQINVVVDDMDAALEFYRRLGLEISDPVGHPTDGDAWHAEVVMPTGARFELDTVAMAKLWHAGLREPSQAGGSRSVIGFNLASREAVDELYAELTDAGYVGAQPPYDTFWRTRYAIVVDPSGNDVGLMSPVEKKQRV